jgi:hypothetical protein
MRISDFFSLTTRPKPSVHDKRLYFTINSIFHHKGEKELLRTRFFSVIFHFEGEAGGVKNTEKKRDP